MKKKRNIGGLIVSVILTVICMVVMYKTKIGRYILAIGSNEEATRLSGINVDKYKIIAYSIGGFFAGLAALFYVASNPSLTIAGGNGMELDAIAGVYIGGTSAAGGVASIAGSVIGNIMLVVIRSGLNFVLARFNLNLNSTYVTFVLTGIIVVVAVLMDVLKNKNAAKVRIDDEKTAAKKARKVAIANIEDEINDVIANKELSIEEKNTAIKALEDQIKAL